MCSMSCVCTRVFNPSEPSSSPGCNLQVGGVYTGGQIWVEIWLELLCKQAMHPPTPGGGLISLGEVWLLVRHRWLDPPPSVCGKKKAASSKPAVQEFCYLLATACGPVAALYGPLGEVEWGGVGP